MLKIRNLFFFVLIFLLFSNSILALNYGESKYGKREYSEVSGVQSGSSFCGDGICNNGETCSSCPKDCENCPSGGRNLYKSIDYHLKIDKGKMSVFKFWGLLSIRKINLTAKENISFPKIAVELLDSDSDKKEIPQLIEDNLIYHYEKITPYNFNNSVIKDLIISFRIKNSWLKDNNLKAKDIVLKRYTYQWDDLNTNFIKEKSGYSYYEAKSPGFSYFAIGNRSSFAIDNSSSFAIGNKSEIELKKNSIVQEHETIPKEKKALTSRDISFYLVGAILISFIFIYFIIKQKKR